MKLLNGKIAIVTGGSGDIGKYIVRTFVQHGAYVIFTFFSSKNNAIKLSYELKNSVSYYEIDLKNLDSSKIFVKKITDKFGRIDILVNNAGIIRDNFLLKMSEKDWDEVIRTNIYSVFNLTKYVIFPMIKQKNGSIINMSSVVGITGNIGQSNYAASKAGIIGFTKSIAKELGKKNIRCNVIAPGYISTQMNSHFQFKIKEEWIKKIPLRRAGHPQDVANCSLFLASDLSNYITGSVFNVNGGMI
ncbi:MAG: 3-oxoacyl-[acyl-carrier-protein] reductase [Flavobacteriales bacterium]|jgi:3-oxoacyl-[acyl-carrier protein] reductase|uniref:3-oxoacyl-[acyl-carrier-protein] reductase n=1 Tax=Blattabacterium sp. (Mastotermes darwiniensis) TaxID=39768 RepID=UPI000231DF0C|nr:3-oxoacyl-[acyl-carrier-protein] reductase [Blattabacterium sp. (Mastotermes darwiniensis)]AER40832.1 3-oxoacyl-[acyl-carrier-protein] reductase [Blattabacterium sp. (Mastotermes darwiniensis) str. MADAR]MDR1804679.1 3-oxoacyl-[acyl-carrier-protein] reductase [Flavobacteriales bacterium]